MKTAQLGDVFEWNGQIVKCEWINEGSKSIGFVIKKTVTCPHCKGLHQVDEGYDIIESSPLFQKNAEPVKTITEE